jgi:hypothetical protein
MAIKDLVVKKSEMGEEAIEKILKPYVRFVDNGEIALDGPFFSLKADEKIGIALLAKDSWRYIPGKEEFAGGMKNADLEKITLLPGNTVRPTVKQLRDKGFIKTEKDIHYPTAKLIFAFRAKSAGKNQ